MKFSALSIPDVLVFEPTVFHDDRGFFFESFHAQRFCQAIQRPVDFVQDNHSKSLKNVLRGLHYQSAPMEQGKLIRVLSGEIFDVAVDIRPHSPSFGQWVGAYLSAENKKQMWIPEGFAHGFLTLSDSAEMHYRTTNFYAPEYEHCIRWDSQEIGIKWPLTTPPLLSKKDETASPNIMYNNLITDN
jgi:dTDP-4-dehydrorhamnose 3,5-epimerase